MSYTNTALLSGVTTVSNGSTVGIPVSGQQRRFHAKGSTTAGAGAATIVIQGSEIVNPGVGDWIDLATISLTLSTTNSSDGYPTDAEWPNVRAIVTAISGTGASVSCVVGFESP